jgi:hypothetical protein
VSLKKNVLIFPCGSEVGLELKRALGKAKEVVLYGASSVSDHGEFVYENYISGLPYVSDDNLVAEINRIVRQYHIDYIIPAYDLVILKLAEASQRGELACKLMTSSYSTCAICCSKQRTHALFVNRLPVPQLYESLDEVSEWPVFLKPDVGCGSRGTVKALNRAEVEFYRMRSKDLLIYEYLPGKEYTVDCFTDRHGKLLFCGGRERMRISNGISVRTVPVDNPRFREFAEVINQTLELRGMWFFQIKGDRHGQLALMEIAPRIAGAMGLYRNLGINFPLMSLYDMEGYDVGVIQNDYPIVFDRALESCFKVELHFEHVSVDYDDCLLINGKLNLQMVTFLYQCLTRGIGISLLTRHAGDLNTELLQYRISALFDSVITIENMTPKSAFIKHTKAIFIDDSFSERWEVQRKIGIPVFAPDAVEGLVGCVC